MDPGVGNTGHIPPPPAQQLPSCTSDLPFVQKMQQMHKISDDLATISMISDERTMIFLPWYLVSHREVPKVGVVNRLRMRIVHNLVEFPPPLIALHPPPAPVEKQAQ